MTDAELTEILNKSRRHIFLTAKEGEDVTKSEFHFLLSNFTYAGLPMLKNLDEILDLIDPHGEICEGRGFKEYVDEIRKTVNDPKLDFNSFLLPLSYRGEKPVFLFEIFHYPLKHEYIMLFIRLDGEESLIDVNNAVSSSFKDHLTGLFNLNTAYDHLFKRREPMYFCLFDLNKFKKINDKYGHAVGDEVLVEIAESLIRISTSNEMFYRRSGDEFMFFDKVDSREYAFSLIKKISEVMEKVRREKFPYFKKNEIISASFGLVYIPAHELEEDFFKKRYMDIIKLADYAMYKAKLNNLGICFLPEEEEMKLLKENNLDEKINEMAAAVRR